jgi:aminopeptidase-like protein
MLEVNPMDIGQEIYNLCVELFPICRSITGNGVRETLRIINKHLPALKTYEVPTGTRAFDWTVPKEWNINDAYIIDPDGNKIVDFSENNLHVVGYSTAVNQSLSLDELQPHLYSLPEQPDAIPYITSYYQERWGFCLTHNQRQALKPGIYQVFIDSTHTQGNLTYG